MKKNNCGNYRPISIISAVAKILGKLIYKQLCGFLNKNNIIVNQQSDFSPLHSTETALLQSANQCL